MPEGKIIRDACSSPEELTSLFYLWKDSEQGRLIDNKLGLPQNPSLAETFKTFVFGAHLAQETFPITNKFPFPSIEITTREDIKTASMVSIDIEGRKSGIIINQSWLMTMSENEGLSLHLVNAGVEEFSHWILLQAVRRRRGVAYIKDLNQRYATTKNKLEASIDEINPKLMELVKASRLEKLISVLTGKSDRQIEELESMLEQSKKLLLDHGASLDEFMGCLWRKKVSQKYYPWSDIAKKNEKEFVELLQHKKSSWGGT